MMTEFEKWFKKLEPKIHINNAANDKDKMRWGWKAALKWAKNQLKNDTNGYFNIIKELEE